jgi:hypothetical protein
MGIELFFSSYFLLTKQNHPNVNRLKLAFNQVVAKLNEPNKTLTPEKSITVWQWTDGISGQRR